jgi:hypothetical protein
MKSTTYPNNGVIDAALDNLRVPHGVIEAR